MKIFIDQGHNPKGADTGASYNDLKEQDITSINGIILWSKEQFNLKGLDIKITSIEVENI